MCGHAVSAPTRPRDRATPAPPASRASPRRLESTAPRWVCPRSSDLLLELGSHLAQSTVDQHLYGGLAPMQQRRDLVAIESGEIAQADGLRAVGTDPAQRGRDARKLSALHRDVLDSDRVSDSARRLKRHRRTSRAVGIDGLAPCDADQPRLYRSAAAVRARRLKRGQERLGHEILRFLEATLHHEV